ncbi:MAG: DegT/DnrJ/EryC1/StrS family aminotransferase [Bryobacteraceae bacterium]|nr:DegT/DnrJ/EryC1/StrS family aminotransferase [Bryobacteraceae bacterium]
MANSDLQTIIGQIQEAASDLRSEAVSHRMQRVTNTVASELRGGILGINAILDDSVSNKELGTVFDLWSPSPLNAMRANLARAYGVMESVPGTSGTTALNVPAVITLAREGEEIGICRDAHISIPAAIVLSGARPSYIEPLYDEELGILLPPTAGEVDEFLTAHPRVKALWLTLPTYYGVQGDIDGIVQVCREHGVRIAIDEAHGPHLKLLGGLSFPRSAEAAGADLITQSTHKVMSALNQGSIIHFNDSELLRRYEEMQSLGFVSTSFSFLILSSIEHAVNQMLTCGKEIWAPAVRLARRLRTAAAAMPGVRVLDESAVDGARVTGIDPTRVTLNVAGTGISGFDIEERIFRMGGVTEMATPEVVLFLVSPGISRTQIDATIEALQYALHNAPGCVQAQLFAPPPIPRRVMTPRQATMHSRRERVRVRNAVGRVSAETISCYPPGQAIVVAGEEISKEAVDYLSRAVSAGAHLKRVRDDNFRTWEVVCEYE